MKILERIKQATVKENIRRLSKWLLILSLINIATLLILVYIYIIFGVSLGADRMFAFVMTTLVVLFSHLFISGEDSYNIYIS